MRRADPSRAEPHGPPDGVPRRGMRRSASLDGDGGERRDTARLRDAEAGDGQENPSQRSLVLLLTTYLPWDSWAESCSGSPS